MTLQPVPEEKIYDPALAPASADTEPSPAAEQEMAEQHEDMLYRIFRRQAAFQRYMVAKTNQPSLPNTWSCNHRRIEAHPVCDACFAVLEERVQHNALALLHEAAELHDWTRWKSWSQQLGNKVPMVPGSLGHFQEMRVEVADALCFLVNCAMWLGMDAEELEAIHADKMVVNYARQEQQGGY